MLNLPGDLNRRMQERVKREMAEEYNREIVFFKEKGTFSKEFEYFLDTLSLAAYPQRLKERFDRPVVGTYCNTVPVELLDALGFHPIRLCCGSLAIQKLSSSSLPVLACPLIKSALSAFHCEQSLEGLCEMLITPTSCDWRVKLPGMVGKENYNFYIMELPHVKEAQKSQKRWLEETYELKRYLERRANRRLDKRKLLNSIHKYMLAWEAFEKLLEMRRKGLISGTESIILANAFMLDDAGAWTKKINEFCSAYNNLCCNTKPRIFLLGSPLFFPQLKISELIEEVGMFIAADDLCTSERLFGSVVYDDTSEYELLRAIAERYQLSCTCPTFIENEHRAKNILEIMQEQDIKGVVYHVFKGCHPFDIESFSYEKIIKEKGFRFIKIETDYSKEDRENILARLEAFKETL